MEEEVTKNLIYIIEDERDIAELIRYNLAKDGLLPVVFETGSKALVELRHATVAPRLILLDLMLPDIDGFDICQRIKSDSNTKNIPVIMITAKGEESDIVRGLELGADDYITKPFSLKVLRARVQNVLRRKQNKNTKAKISFGKLHVHPGKHEVYIGDNAIVNLTKSEFQVLSTLIQKPGWVFTRAQIVDNIRGENYAVTSRSVDVLIVGLRRKLKECGDLIETIRGIGYRLRTDSEH